MYFFSSSSVLTGGRKICLASQHVILISPLNHSFSYSNKISFNKLYLVAFSFLRFIFIIPLKFFNYSSASKFFLYLATYLDCTCFSGGPWTGWLPSRRNSSTVSWFDTQAVDHEPVGVFSFLMFSLSAASILSLSTVRFIVNIQFQLLLHFVSIYFPTLTKITYILHIIQYV